MSPSCRLRAWTVRPHPSSAPRRPWLRWWWGGPRPRQRPAAPRARPWSGRWCPWTPGCHTCRSARHNRKRRSHKKDGVIKGSLWSKPSVTKNFSGLTPAVRPNASRMNSALRAGVEIRTRPASIRWPRGRCRFQRSLALSKTWACSPML